MQEEEKVNLVSQSMKLLNSEGLTKEALISSNLTLKSFKLQLDSIVLHKFIHQIEGLLVNSTLPKSLLVVTYYNLGFYHLSNYHFHLADRYLSNAFNLYYKNDKRKQKTLFLLTIVRMIRGSALPYSNLLEKYNLNFMIPIIHHFKSANFAGFNTELNKHMQLFLKWNVYSILKYKTRPVMFQSLLRHIMSSNKIDVSKIQFAFGFSGLKCSVNQVESILSSLISDGLIAGYISHNNSLVVSRLDGFPRAKGVYDLMGI